MMAQAPADTTPRNLTPMRGLGLPLPLFSPRGTPSLSQLAVPSRPSNS
jgi:cytochrome o ubiquinol oxidase subunit 2